MDLLQNDKTFPQSNKDNVENLNIILDRSEQGRRVYIGNQSGHDFSPSSKYGSPIYVTKGLVNRFSVNYMARRWAFALLSSKKEDYILLTSLTILTVVGAAIFAYLHGSLNLLLYRNGKYINRTIDFKELFLSLKEGNQTEKESLQ